MDSPLRGVAARAKNGLSPVWLQQAMRCVQGASVNFSFNESAIKGHLCVYTFIVWIYCDKSYCKHVAYCNCFVWVVLTMMMMMTTLSDLVAEH